MNEVYACCGAIVFVYMLQFHLMFPRLNRKPFNCDVCLSGWFSLILNLGGYWLLVPFKMAFAMVLTVFLSYIIRKI